MAIGTNFPVEGIESLSAQVKKAATDLDTTLSGIRMQVQRDPNFAGTAAERYDGFVAEWDTGQAKLLEGLRGAAGILDSLATNLRLLNDSVLRSFG